MHLTLLFASIISKIPLQELFISNADSIISSNSRSKKKSYQATVGDSDTSDSLSSPIKEMQIHGTS